jgi:hypothetical protein
VNALTAKTNKLSLQNEQQNPIYSQVQPKQQQQQQLYPTDRMSAQNGNNRNLIITNGTTNADSWV